MSPIQHWSEREIKINKTKHMLRGATAAAKVQNMLVNLETFSAPWCCFSWSFLKREAHHSDFTRALWHLWLVEYVSQFWPSFSTHFCCWLLMFIMCYWFGCFWLMLSTLTQSIYIYMTCSLLLPSKNTVKTGLSTAADGVDTQLAEAKSHSDQRNMVFHHGWVV